MNNAAFVVDVNRLCALHEAAIAQWGGTWGLPKVDCLEGVTQGAFESMSYRTDGQADALVYASFLLRNVAMHNCLIDGNKRVAWLACVDALLAVGLSIRATSSEAAEFVENEVVKGHASVDQIAAWIAPRLVAAEELDTPEDPATSSMP
jgi:death on curing protein